MKTEYRVYRIRYKDGRRIRRGTFKTEEEAVKAARAGASARNLHPLDHIVVVKVEFLETQLHSY